MPHLRSKQAWALTAVLAALSGCSFAPVVPSEEAKVHTIQRDEVGLMTSLPLYWPEGTEMADLAAGRGDIPWQRQAIEARYRIVPLDTLSPISALSADAQEIDPIADISRLAVIQPRGLSPADSVALDQWVRAGGRLLLVLDPALTGEYDVPLGDPRRPVDSAPIPAVVARWGMSVSFDATQDLAVSNVALAGAELPLALPGRIAITDPAAAGCNLMADGAAATCRVGAGRVTLITDAALFEHSDFAGEDGARLLAVLAATLE
jgi:hypothetical protein